MGGRAAGVPGGTVNPSGEGAAVVVRKEGVGLW